MASDLRRKLIREVLDSDKNINKRVSQIQIKIYLEHVNQKYLDVTKTLCGLRLITIVDQMTRLLTPLCAYSC